MKDKLYGNRVSVSLFISFTLLIFAADAVIGMAGAHFDALFYSLLPEPHDWDNDAFIDALILWDSQITWLAGIANVAGLAVWMIAGRKFLNINSYAVCLVTSAVFFAICVAALPLATGLPAVALTAVAVFIGSSALGLLLWRVARDFPAKRLGLLIGGGMALKYVLWDLLIFPLFWDEFSLELLAGIICISAIAAALAGIGSSITDAFKQEAQPKPKAGNPDVAVARAADLGIPLMPGKFVAVLIAVIFICLTVSSIVHDQMFSFLDVFIEYPSFGIILSQAGLIIYVLAGFFFDKWFRSNALLIGVLCIGANLAMVLFFEQSQLFGGVLISAVYYVIRNIGSILIGVAALALPVYYAALGNRYIPPQTGFVLSPLCAFIVSFSFDATRPVYDVIDIFNEQFTPALGVALIFTFAAFALLFLLFGIREKHERKVALAAIKGLSEPVQDELSEPMPGGDGDGALSHVSEIRQKLTDKATVPLTPRELEVAELTVLGIKRKIIADTLFIQSSTVDSHRISIYSKFGVHTRDELLGVLDG